MLQQTDATVSLKFKSVLQDDIDLNSSKCCISTTASPENSPVVPTIIRDGSVGSGGNHCRKYISCRQLQGCAYLARCARNVWLIKSRRMMKSHQQCQLL